LLIGFPGITGPAGKVFQTIDVYGGAPPVGIELAVPSLSPLQVIFVKVALGKISNGSKISIVSLTVHKESSVTVT